MNNKIFGKKDFEELFNHWFNDLMGFVYSYVRDEEVARDIVHEYLSEKHTSFAEIDYDYRGSYTYGANYLFSYETDFTVNYTVGSK